MRRFVLPPPPPPPTPPSPSPPPAVRPRLRRPGIRRGPWREPPREGGGDGGAATWGDGGGGGTQAAGAPAAVAATAAADAAAAAAVAAAAAAAASPTPPLAIPPLTATPVATPPPSGAAPSTTRAGGASAGSARPSAGVDADRGTGPGGGGRPTPGGASPGAAATTAAIVASVAAATVAAAGSAAAAAPDAAGRRRASHARTPADARRLLPLLLLPLPGRPTVPRQSHCLRHRHRRWTGRCQGCRGEGRENRRMENAPPPLQMGPCAVNVCVREKGKSHAHVGARAGGARAGRWVGVEKRRRGSRSSRHGARGGPRRRPTAWTGNDRGLYRTTADGADGGTRTRRRP